MPKERTINPAEAQRKAEKAKAIKKSKSEASARRTEKLARRNPERLQKQIEDLEAIEQNGGKLTSHEQKVLAELERDLKAVRKARESLGDRAPTYDRGDRSDYRDGRNGGSRILGKRRRGDAEDIESNDSDIPEDVKSIPMPRDTPPPIPKEALDRWYEERRERSGYRHSAEARKSTGTNSASMGDPVGRGAGLPTRPGTDSGNTSGQSTIGLESKTVYEAAPMIRDLRKEAVSRFVPAAVRAKIDKVKGSQALVEPEEADMLEREGYFGAPSDGGAVEEGGASPHDGEGKPLRSHPVLERGNPRAATVEDPVDDGEYGDD